MGYGYLMGYNIIVHWYDRYNCTGITSENYNGTYSDIGLVNTSHPESL